MSKKILLISTLLCCILLAGVISVFAGGGVALAENSNVSIDIVNDSSFTAHGDAFAAGGVFTGAFWDSVLQALQA